MSIVSYPPSPRTSTSTVINGATVVTLAFDAEGVVAAAAGPVTVTDARIEGTDTVVLDVVTPRGGLRAAVVGPLGTARAADGQLVYTVPGGLPASGGATILLTSRASTKRADHTLAPAPPVALVYQVRDGQTGALAMTLDARTQAVRIEAHDPTPGLETKQRLWTVLRTDPAAPGAYLLPLGIADDTPGRRFRAVALRTVAGDVLASSPSAETYRNRPPVSAGARSLALPVGGKTARVSLLTLVTDPDGEPMTFRVVAKHAVFGRDALPVWARIDGTDLVVETNVPHAAVTVVVVGVDERGAAASADLTLSVYVPAGPDAPGRVEYVPVP